MDVQRIHGAWAWVVVGGNGLAGLWALAAHRVEALRTKALWWFTAAVEVAIFVQVVLGVILLSAQGRHVQQMHTFYGFLGIITVALVYSYRQQLAPHRYLLYGFGGLFLMGLALRAMQFGPG